MENPPAVVIVKNDNMYSRMWRYVCLYACTEHMSSFLLSVNMFVCVHNNCMNQDWIQYTKSNKQPLKGPLPRLHLLIDCWMVYRTSVLPSTWFDLGERKYKMTRMSRFFFNRTLGFDHKTDGIRIYRMHFRYVCMCMYSSYLRNYMTIKDLIWTCS